MIMNTVTASCISGIVYYSNICMNFEEIDKHWLKSSVFPTTLDTNVVNLPVLHSEHMYLLNSI